MRVIEPKNTQRRPSSTSKKKHKKRPVRTFSAFGVLMIGTFGFLALANSYYKVAQQAPQDTLATATVQDLEKVAAARDVKFKFFTGDQFQRLYESIQYPNAQTLLNAPSITGNAVADARIRTIAESRGYGLRSVPVRPIVKTGEPRLQDDDLLQPKAYNAWQVLKDMAVKDGVPLGLNSGYRSIEMQRELFISRMNTNGSSTSAVAAGQADNAVVATLLMTAPPGYSRHHTGYTIDLVCDNNEGQNFEKTTCFEWISANNYDKAKRAGWVPSYPEGVDSQGPEPEPWEYVWVGIDQVIE